MKSYLYGVLALVLLLGSCVIFEHARKNERVIKPNLNVSISQDSTADGFTSLPDLMCLLHLVLAGEVLSQLDDWEALIRHPSKKTLRKFGGKTVIKAFQENNADYNLRLKRYHRTKDGKIIFNYEVTRCGRRGEMRIIVQKLNHTIQVSTNTTYQYIKK